MNPADMKLNTWYKSGNTMMYPYQRNEDETIYMYSDTHNGDTFSMLTYQVITHFGPERWELEDTDQWQIKDQMWKRSKDSKPYRRLYLYWDENEWVMEGEDITLPESQDFYNLINAIFIYQQGWS